MNADKTKTSLDTLTELAISAIFEVSNILGTGFLEKVYERALLKELSIRGLVAAAQPSMPVTYKGECVGEYFADIIVENALLIELKCVEHLVPEHTAK